MIGRTTLILLGLMLSACAGGPPRLPGNAIQIAPDLALVLPRPGELGRGLEATQLVTAHYRDQTMVFEAHISANSARFLMVVVDPLGRRALSVTWTDHGIAADPAPFLPSSIHAENMLADLVVLYWPQEVVRQAIASSGGTLVMTPEMRSISVAGREVIHADFQPSAAGETWAGHAVYRNVPWGYDLDIQSVLSTQ